MSNKYEQLAEAEIDLHGYITEEAREVLGEVVSSGKYKHVRVIVGKGKHSAGGAILPDFVKAYLNSHNIKYNQSKIKDGGEGALEVFLR